MDHDTLRDRVLLRGIAFPQTFPGLDIARDIVIAGGPNGRDLQMVTGMSNLAQDLAVAFTTAIGSDPFDTGFGFDGLRALSEPLDRVLVRERIRIAVIALLRRDPRVSRVVDVNLNDGRLDVGTTDSDEARALRHTRTLEVRVQIETIAGESLDVRMGDIHA